MYQRALKPFLDRLVGSLSSWVAFRDELVYNSGDNLADHISAGVVLIFDYSSTSPAGICVCVSQIAPRRPMLSEFCLSRRIWPGPTDRRAGEINNSPKTSATSDRLAGILRLGGGRN